MKINQNVPFPADLWKQVAERVFELFKGLSTEELRSIRRMLEKKTNRPKK